MSTPADTSVVSIKGLTKSFRTGVTALEDIGLEIRPGEFVSLIGPSGCGKSTLLRVIGDLIQPTSGQVLVNGKSAHQARLDHDYGIVFQDAVLYDWRTVARNVSLPLELLRWDRARRKQRVQEMLELVELTGFESSRPWQLSGGMQQRVSIARALSFDPALLLMDEPFGALDEMTRERLNMQLLRIWDASGSTIVFVTHSIPEAVFLSTRVVVMSPRPGRIAQVIDVDLPQPRGAATREDTRFFELVTAVREALAAGGGHEAGLPRRHGGALLTSTVIEPIPRGLTRELGGRARDWIPALVVFVLGVGLWQGLTTVFDVETFLLPKPSDIAQAFWTDKAVLWDYGVYTLKEAAGGFVLGSGLGILTALLLTRFRAAGRAIMPFAIAANAVPIIAFAPITNNWFGLLNPFSKMAIAAVLCFFPTMVNTLRGLTSVNPRSIELMRSYAAGEASTFRHVRIPNSLPFMFTGLKVAAVLSMIGAIVGEYFGGPTNALGVSILNDTQLFNFPRAWAGIVLASVFGILFYGAVALAERLTTSWAPAARGFRGE